jgi:hypothetical protein
MTAKTLDTTPASRRQFLASAAAATVAIATAAVPASAASDPIHDAIAIHRAAEAAFAAVLERESALCAELRRRRSKLDYETDPRWIETEAERDAACDATFEAAWAILAVQPTTVAGVAAALRYAAENCEAGNAWPNDPPPNSRKPKATESWNSALHRHLADALAQIGGGA